MSLPAMSRVSRPRRRHRTGAAWLLCALVVGGAASTPLPPVAAAQAPDSVVLEWKLVPGEELVYVQTMENQMELPRGMGMSTSSMQMRQRWNVLELDDGGAAVVRVTHERIRLGVQTPMGTMAVDSADETPAPAGLDVVTRMAGLSYVLAMEPSGALKEIVDIDELTAMLESISGNPAVAGVLESVLGEEGLRNAWEQGVTAMPLEPVSVGTTWERSMELPLPMAGSMSLSTHYEVSDIATRDDRTVVTLAITGTMTSADQGPGGGAGADVFEIKQTGTSEFDVTSGRLLRTDMNMRTFSRMYMGGEQIEMGMVGTLNMVLADDPGQEAR